MSTTKDRILKAAKVIWSQDSTAGFGAIATEAGVGRATVFRHFASREDLATELCAQALDELDRDLAAVEGGELTGWDGLLAMLASVADHAGTTAFLAAVDWSTVPPELAERYEQARMRTSAFVEQARRAGDISIEMPTAWVVRAIDALAYAAWEGVVAGDIAPNAVADLLTRTVTTGVAPGPDAGP